MKYAPLFLAMSAMCSAAIAAPSKEDQEQKLSQDPTKVVTQLGASHADDRTRVSGSLSFDPVRKINGSAEIGGGEWRLGGSWLFGFGIVNFNFGNNEFDSGAEQTSYSIGTFIPLSTFDISPGGWQLFAMGGITYVDGKLAVEAASYDSSIHIFSMTEDVIYVPTSNVSAYLGAFGLKPLTDKWTWAAFGMGSYGSEDALGDNYSGYAIGTGLGYQFTKRQALNIYASYQDNSFGTDEKIGVSYRYQFQ